MKLLAAALGVAIATGPVEGAAPSRPLVVRNVTMRVADTIEYLHVEPATFAIVWIDVAFDLVNVGSRRLRLKDFRIHYTLPEGWREGMTSPGLGWHEDDHYLYSIDLGAIEPGGIMRRRHRIGIEPPFAEHFELAKISLRTRKPNSMISLRWTIDYEASGRPRTRQWCWMAGFGAAQPTACARVANQIRK
jgi:hypothetical protein